MIINMNGAKAPETPSPVLQEKTVTPETLPTVIGADEGYDGLSQVTVNPDSQLKAENIRSGKTIFGVEGSFVGEPQPTDELDITLITRHGSTFNSTLGFATSPSTWNYSPVRLMELDFTTQDYLNNANGAMVGYDSGGIVSKTDTTQPYFTSSSYLPSVDSYHYYKETGAIEGEVTFYISYNLAQTMGWLSGTNRPSHIKGSMYVFLAMHGITYATSTPYATNGYTGRTYGYGGGIYEIEVDSPFTFEQLSLVSTDQTYSFNATVPKIEGSVVYSNYSALVQTCICLMAYPNKMVIS